VDGKIDLRLGPASHTLDDMIAANEGPFDFVFIDADKPGYDAYYERALKLVRQGGLIVLDNMLLSGKVADPADMDVSPAALRALNEKILKDDRVEMALTTIGDGMTLCIRR
jgi:caffeoyl-CoA O-methyltransferase